MTAEYQNDSDLSYVSFENVVNVPQEDRARNAWFDAFTLRKTTFPDGQMEISVCKEKHFNGAALSPFPANRTKRGESEERVRNDEVAGKKAKKTVRERCKQIGADRLVTLTYRENVTDRERALKDFDSFRRRLKNAIPFHYVAVMENQTRGAIHFHIAVHGKQNYNLLRSVWQRVVGQQDGKQMGQVNVRNPTDFGFGKKGVHRLAAYIAKYCTKAMECRDINQRRHFSSKGIPKPEVVQWRLHSDDMLSAVNAAVSFAMEGNIEGMTIWCNNALGVVWIATPPGLSASLHCPF
jgi:hypothetical protein